MLTYDNVSNGNYSEEMRSDLNKVYKVMRSGGITKEECIQLTGRNERTARDIMSAIGFKQSTYFIEDTDGKHRFFISQSPHDVPMVERKMFDKLSRCEEMLYSIIKDFEFCRDNGVDWCDLEVATKKFLNAVGAKRIAQSCIQKNND